MKNAALKKFMVKYGKDDHEPDNDEDDKESFMTMGKEKEPKRKLTVSDDPKWKGKLGKHDDCWK